MAGVDIEDTLSQDLNCPICLELLTDPVTLYNCFHSFCRPCLQGAIIGARETFRHPFSCPQCRRHFVPSDVDKVNHHLQSIVNSHRKSREKAAAAAERAAQTTPESPEIGRDKPTLEEFNTLTAFLSTVDARLQCLISALDETSVRQRDAQDPAATEPHSEETSVNPHREPQVETSQLDESSRLCTQERPDCDFEAETLKEFAQGSLGICKKHFILIVFVIHACVLLLLILLAAT